MLERTSVEHASQNINIEHLSLIEYSAKVFFLSFVKDFSAFKHFCKVNVFLFYAVFKWSFKRLNRTDNKLRFLVLFST